MPKSKPSLLLHVYKPKFGGRKFALRLGPIIIYGLAVWNPHWLNRHPAFFFVHPRRIGLGAEIVIRMWKLHTTVRIQRLQFRSYLEPRHRLWDRDESQIILNMAASAFAGRTFAPTHRYGGLDRSEKLALFWDALNSRKEENGD